jgi:hypothetical protein
LFFTRFQREGDNPLKNNDFGESYVVLYKIGRIWSNQPNLCRGMLQIQSYVVLYKRGDAALPIELPLALPVALGCLGMRAPVGLLIIGVLGTPLLPAVLDYLRIHRVGLNLLPMVIGPAMPLALRLAANALLESIWGWMKASLAVRTAAGLGQCVSSEIERDSNF